MSVVVAIKQNGRVYMGCDSQVTSGGSRNTLKNPNNYKIWKVDDIPNSVMGSVGMLRDACVVRVMHGLKPKKDVSVINYKYVVNVLFPKITQYLRDIKFYALNNEKVEFLESTFMFANKDKLFVLGLDYSVIEIEDYHAIGSGSPEAIGSLISTEGEDPETRIIKAIKASATHDLYVNYPIILTNTHDKKFKVLSQADVDKEVK